jgi:hypothetical protein
MFRKTTPCKTRATTWLNQAVRVGSSLPIRYGRVTRLFRKSRVLLTREEFRVCDGGGRDRRHPQLADHLRVTAEQPSVEALVERVREVLVHDYIPQHEMDAARVALSSLTAALERAERELERARPSVRPEGGDRWVKTMSLAACRPI